MAVWLFIDFCAEDGDGRSNMKSKNNIFPAYWLETLNLKFWKMIYSSCWANVPTVKDDVLHCSLLLKLTLQLMSSQKDQTPDEGINSWLASPTRLDKIRDWIM